MNIILDVSLSAAVVARSWSHYFYDFCTSSGVCAFPRWWVSMEIFSTGAKGWDSLIDLDIAAVLVLLVTTVVVAVGVRESATINTVVVVVKILALSIFMFVGFTNFHEDHIADFAPNGVSGIYQGASIIFFAYLGFDSVAAMAEEVRSRVLLRILLLLTLYSFPPSFVVFIT